MSVFSQQVVNQMVLFDITQLGKDNGLHSFEQVRVCVFVCVCVFVSMCVSHQG